MGLADSKPSTLQDLFQLQVRLSAVDGVHRPFQSGTAALFCQAPGRGSQQRKRAFAASVDLSKLKLKSIFVQGESAQDIGRADPEDDRLTVKNELIQLGSG